MFNRLGFRCVACGKELTGGLDTYGDYDQPLCQEHYLELVPDDTAVRHSRMLLMQEEQELIAEREALRTHARQINKIDDLEPVEARIKMISRRLWQIDKVLSGYL